MNIRLLQVWENENKLIIEIIIKNNKELKFPIMQKIVCGYV